MKKYTKEFRQIREILSNATVGFEFEFYTTYSFTKLLEIINSELHPVEVRGFRRYHSDFKPTAETWKIEPDMSGGPNMVELVTGPMPHDMAKLNLSRVMGFMQRHAHTNDHCSVHVNLSYAEGSDKTMAGLSPLKMIMAIDEDSIYRDFPKRDGNIYAKSVRRILPLDGLQYVDRQDVLERSLKLPKTKYYGINFSNPDRVEFRYIGGKDYHLKAGRVSQWVDQFFMLLWNSTDVDLTEGEMSQLKGLLDQNWRVYGSFSTLDTFVSQWPGVKLEVDRDVQYEVLRHYWPSIKDDLHELLTSVEYGDEMTVSYVTESDQLEVYNANIEFKFPLSGLDFISCDIKGLTGEKFSFVDCEVSKSSLHNSNAWDTTFSSSQLNKVDVNARCVLKRCFFSGGYMNGQMEGGVMRSGQLGPSAYVARNVKQTSAVSVFDITTKDKDKKKLFNNNGL